MRSLLHNLPKLVNEDNILSPQMKHKQVNFPFESDHSNSFFTGTSIMKHTMKQTPESQYDSNKTKFKPFKIKHLFQHKIPLYQHSTVRVK